MVRPRSFWDGRLGLRNRRGTGARRPLTRIAKGAVTMLVAAVAGTGQASAATIFNDGFESGDFSAWSQVQTGGDGSAVVQSAIVRTRTLAAQLAESSASGSKAYLRKTFDSPQTDLTVSGDFQLLKEGASGGNVPFFRFLDPASARLLSVYRQNASGGSIGIGYGSSHFSSTGSLPLSTWGTIVVHAVTAGANSTLEVRLNGALIYRTTSAGLGTAGVSTIQLGNDTTAQAFNLVIDTISADSGAAPVSSPPVNTMPPNVSGTPQVGQKLTASTGNWNGNQPITYAYQWQQCGASGGSCGPITGATGQTYISTSADVGHTLRVIVTASNADGSASATSAATGVVQSTSSPPANTASPTISGTAQNGQTLHANPGSWSGTQTISYAYQWQRCDINGSGCASIAGAIDPAYTLAGADVGSTMRVVVTAANSVGSASATSNATTVVQASSGQAGVVALWHMDETSGTVMRDSVAGHDGTLFSVQLGVPGFSGTAFGFTGSSYASVPSAGDLNPGGAVITVTIHLKTTSVPATPDWDLIRKGLYTSPGGEYKMEYQPTGQASCGFKGSANYGELITGPALNDGQWHTVQCVKTSSDITLIVDGKTFSKSFTIGSIANTDAVPIGARPGSEYFKGSLDEAGVQVG
jgi:hypothetical protein